MQNGSPISPQEVVNLKRLSVPPEVFDSFNECIVNTWDGECANFTRERVMNAISNRTDLIRANDLFWKNWRDVVTRYENQGWSVTYKMPDIDECFKAYFIFKIK